MKKPEILYHGSSEFVDILLPNKAEDWLNDSGSQYGVFATSNRNIALCFALGAKTDEDGNISRFILLDDESKEQIVFVLGHPNFGGKGYLYTLSSEGFEYVGGSQWVCKNPVKPNNIEEIEVNDYLHLFRYPDEKDLDRINKLAKK